MTPDPRVRVAAAGELPAAGRLLDAFNRKRRGTGLGRALLSRAMEEARARGADRMDLGTSEDDVAARALYERLGFTRHEGPGGPVMYVYEREL